MFKREIKIILLQLIIIFCMINVAYTEEANNYQPNEKDLYSKSNDLYKTYQLLPRSTFGCSEELKYYLTNQLDIEDIDINSYMYNMLASLITDLEYSYLPDSLKHYKIIIKESDHGKEHINEKSIITLIESLRLQIVLRESKNIYYIIEVLEYSKKYINNDRFISSNEAEYLNNLLNAWQIAFYYHAKFIEEDVFTSDNINKFNKYSKELVNYIEKDSSNIHITPLMQTMYENIKNGGLNIDYEKLRFYNFPY